jgi:DNA ligase-4
MPLPFSLVCDLLEESYILATARKPVHPVFAAWCTQHRSRINAPDTNLAALLSTLLPEKRTDRVYGIQANGLERIIGRALMLGSSRIKELAIYKQPGLGLDLGDCVERILNVTVSYDEIAFIWEMGSDPYLAQPGFSGNTSGYR